MSKRKSVCPQLDSSAAKSLRLLSLLLTALWLQWAHCPSAQTRGLQPSPVQTTPQQQSAGGNAQEVTTLEPGKPVERELSGGQQHGYQLILNEGQYAKLIVEQRGIDLVVRVLGPDGKQISEFDDELRAQGEETSEVVAGAAGSYRLDVHAKWRNTPVAHYKVRLVELRAATDRDRLSQEARRLLAESVSLRRAGKYDQALPLGKQAADNWERLLGSEQREVANSLSNLGDVLRMKGDYVKAEQLYSRALEIREKVLGPDHPDAASSLNNLGILNYSKGMFDKAEELYNRALKSWEKALGPEHPLVANSLQNLAIVYVEKGDNDKAEQFYKRSLEIREKVLGPEDRDVAYGLNNLAILYLRRGDYDKAEQLWKRALGIREKVLGPDHPDLAPTLNNLALISHYRGDYDQAEELNKRALEIYKKALGSEHPLVATTLNNLVTVHLDRGDYGKAEELGKRALEIREKALGPEHHHVGSTLHNLAIVYRKRGDFDKAEQMNQRALEIAEKTLGQEHPTVSEMLDELASLYAAKGNLDQAVTTQRRANKIIERNIALNLVTGSERQKLAYLNKLSEITDRSLSLHTRNTSDRREGRELAVTIILQRKGRVQDAMSDGLAGMRRRFNAQDQKLLDQLNDTTERLARLVLNGPQKTSLTEHQQQIAALEAQKEQIENEISNRSAGFYTRAEPVTLATVQAAIPANAALIEIFTYRPFDPKAVGDERKAYGDPRYVVYVLRHEGEVEWKELGEAKLIDEAIHALRDALRDPHRNDVKQLARAVDKKVMQPVRALAGDATHLLVSPDGQLNLIPFEALVDEQEHYLVENYDFTYLTSGRDLLRMKVARESSGQPVVVADPAFGGPAIISMPGAEHGNASKKPAQIDYSQIFFGPLPGVSDEVRALRVLLPQAVFLTKERANETALKRLTGPRVLHIATHGFFLTNDPQVKPQTATQAIAGTRVGKWIGQVENPLLRSGLALAGANQGPAGSDDGVLTAFEASGLNLWGTKLVVLSACDTGLGEVKNGEGVYGLRRAFLLAGAESLMMSLWPVSDRSTRDLMIGYYKRLVQNEGRNSALRQVQLQMLRSKSHRHPHYWASFIQTGEWANLQGKR